MSRQKEEIESNIGGDLGENSMIYYKGKESRRSEIVQN